MRVSGSPKAGDVCSWVDDSHLSQDKWVPPNPRRFGLGLTQSRMVAKPSELTCPWRNSYFTRKGVMIYGKRASDRGWRLQQACIHHI